MAAIFALGNLLSEHPRMSGVYPRDLVMVAFKPGATADERLAAIEQVEGRVVGGDGAHYFVKVTSGTDPVWWAADKLSALAQVEAAYPFMSGGVPGYRRPNNGTGWARADWEVHPDSSRGRNWAAEAIAAPGAWGCETGSAAFPIAVVDYGQAHGQEVTSIINNPANTNAGTTGLMWTSNVLRSDASRGGTVTDGRAREMNLYRDLRAAYQQGARIINLSVDLAYFQSDKVTERLPRVGNAEDILYARNYADAWRRRIVAIEAEFTTVRPLYVIGAGNLQLPASYSGWPQLATGALASRVITVAAHDSARAAAGSPNRVLWANSGIPLVPGSNTGAQVAAPGAHVHGIVGGREFIAQGTSYATPFVTAIARLLLSQLPSRDAATLRQYILDGANRGGRSAGTQPIANAYESLRRGAENPGAPLCGNRVWAVSGQIYAQRGTGAPQPLGPAETVNAPYEVEPLHGGKHVTYNTTGGRRTLVWNASGWTLGSLPADYWPDRAGGTTSSVFFSSHGNDSTVSLTTGTVNNNEWWRTGDQVEVPVLLNNSTELGRITVNDLPDPSKSICVERIPPTSSDPASAVCTITFSTSRWWLFRAAFPQAYQPVVVTVSPIYTTLVDSTAWRTCSTDATLQCRNVRWDRLEAGTRVYRIPLTGGQPTLLKDLAGGPVFWIGHTEVTGRTTPSDTLVMGRGAWTIQYSFNPDTWRQTGDGDTVVKGEIANCGIEYRALVGFNDGQRIETNNVCNWNYLDYPGYAGGGTMAPVRSAASGLLRSGGQPARVYAPFTPSATGARKGRP